jgi:hypothetical protein
MSYSRSAIMKAAWAEWRKVKAKGWHLGPDPLDFAWCLRMAHRMAKQRKAEVAAYHSADRRTRKARDFIFLQAA